MSLSLVLSHNASAHSFAHLQLSELLTAVGIDQIEDTFGTISRVAAIITLCISSDATKARYIGFREIHPTGNLL